MNKVLATCSVVLLVAIAVRAQETNSSPGKPAAPGTPASPWVTLTSEAGNFSVLMPELAKDESETTSSANGRTSTSHHFRVKTVRGMFLVGWVDYDPEFNFVVQSELQNNRDNFVKGLNGTLLNTTRITINGNPGLEFTVETAESIYKTRVYAIGRRSYLLFAQTLKGQDDSDNVKRFFDSFQLLR
jgi:hypothetical protein